MTLPNFFIIGAMRAATTSYYKLLDQHPDIFFCEPKEPSYFVHNWDRGIDWYESLYADADRFAVRGDASTDYSKAPQFPDVPARIAEVAPDARFVYLLRHPIDRMVSQYVAGVRAGYEKMPIDRALRENPSYLDNSRFAFQTEQFLRHFGRDRLLLLLTSDLESEVAGVMKDSLAFLDLPDSWSPAQIDKQTNSTSAQRRRRGWDRALDGVPFRAALGRLVPERVRMSYRGAARSQFEQVNTQITPETQAWIAAALAEDLTRLRQLMGPTFDCWGLLE